MDKFISLSYPQTRRVEKYGLKRSKNWDGIESEVKLVDVKENESESIKMEIEEKKVEKEDDENKENENEDENTEKKQEYFDRKRYHAEYRKTEKNKEYMKEYRKKIIKIYKGIKYYWI